MNKIKICIYVICKNEEQFVNRFMNSVKDADFVIIGDTGSTDKTRELFKERGAIVYDLDVNPWRFDKARNELLSHIPKDIDVCFSLDADEILGEGWRKCIEEKWTKTTTLGRYLYIWSFNEDGSPAVMYHHHRMHSRKDYRWIYPTHEVIEFIGEGNEEHVFIDNLKVLHYPDKNKDRSFNLELLELALQEYPNDCRNTHYLGREYFFAGLYDKCIDILKKYLSHPESNWKEERCASMIYIARSYKEKKNYEKSKSWFYRAISETPYSRDPYIALVKLCYDLKEWNIVYFAITEALKIENKNINGYPNDPDCWNSYIYDIGAIACYYLGLYKEALLYVNKALDYYPNDERLKKNLSFIKDKL